MLLFLPFYLMNDLFSFFFLQNINILQINFGRKICNLIQCTVLCTGSVCDVTDHSDGIKFSKPEFEPERYKPTREPFQESVVTCSVRFIHADLKNKKCMFVFAVF